MFPLPFLSEISTNRTATFAGLLRKSNATVILATHATYYARYADRIIVLSDGRVSEEGTYQQLAERNVNFKALDGSAGEENHDIDSGADTHTDLDVSFELPSPQTEPDAEDEDEEDSSRRAGDRRSFFFMMKAVGPLHVSIYWTTATIATVATQIQCK